MKTMTNVPTRPPQNNMNIHKGMPVPAVPSWQWQSLLHKPHFLQKFKEMKNQINPVIILTNLGHFERIRLCTEPVKRLYTHTKRNQPYKKRPAFAGQRAGIVRAYYIGSHGQRWGCNTTAGIAFTKTTHFPSLIEKLASFCLHFSTKLC